MVCLVYVLDIEPRTIQKIMGAVYKSVEPRKQKGRFIYNRNRLHKVGWQPKHKTKHILLRLDGLIQLTEYYNNLALSK